MGAESSGQDGKAMAYSEPGLLLSFHPNQGTSVRIGGRFPADGGERVWRRRREGQDTLVGVGMFEG